MNRELACKVADAVLYEGYMLYPYRPSAIKNRQRWSFGILYPPAYSEVLLGTERCNMHSECLLEIQSNRAQQDASLQIQLRFLHLLSRQYGQSIAGHAEAVPSLRIDDQLYESWDEPIERSLDFELASLTAAQRFPFAFSATHQCEPMRDRAGQPVGTVSRSQCGVSGTVSFASTQLSAGLFKLTIDVSNTTPLPQRSLDRNAALLCSMLSTHCILSASNAQFVSLLDPPANLSDLTAACHNLGNFPVLVGSAPARDMLLCSPIVLYDYPQIAPESASDFFDATEMDEMLTLRIMTLTDTEKDEARGAGDRVRNLLQSTEQTAREQLMKTHGAIRSMRPTGGHP
jgi:hydrogenase maturation protease